jgi:hypothetical protein
VKLLNYRHIIVGETYFIGEELHEILHNSNNEEYTENKHSKGCNVQIDKENDENKKVHFRGKTIAEKNMKLLLLHVQSIRLFHISLEKSGGKKHLLL